MLFLRTLIEHLTSSLSVDESRIYLTGHSNGGMMTYRMAAEYPELFAAVAPVAASIGGKATPESNLYIIPDPSSALSLIHIHGYKDRNVLYNGGVSESGFNVGERYDLSVNNSISFWIENNNCSKPAIIESSIHSKIIMETYSNGINDTEVNLVTFNEQNHFWENLNKELNEEEFYGKNMAEMIWSLLRQYYRK